MGSSITPIVAITLNASADGNTVEYSSANNQNIKIPSTSYFHLTLSTSGYKYLLGSISLLGNMHIISSAILEVNGNNYNITIEGNWTHDEGGATFDELYGTVTF